MSSSILNDVKHSLDLMPEDTAADAVIIMGINTHISTLTQLGVGPSTGFEITGPEETWDQFIETPLLNGVKSYLNLNVRLLFDPPGTGFTQDSFDRQIAQLEFRILSETDY